MPRDQETTSEPVPVGTRTGASPADTTATGPDDTAATNGGAFADRDVTSADQDMTSPADPTVGTDPIRATVPDLGDPDLGDPDLDAVPDAAASQSTGAVATGTDTTRLGQPATGAHAAPPAGTPGSAAGADAAFAAAGAAFVTDADGYRASWVRIQSGFVDDPRIGDRSCGAHHVDHQHARLGRPGAGTYPARRLGRQRRRRHGEPAQRAARLPFVLRAPDRRVTPRSMSRPARFAGRGRDIDASA